MPMILIWLAGALAIALGALLLWRQLDHRADWAEMQRLVDMQPDNPERFSHQMLEGLPEPVRRYFTYAIAEGTELRRVAVIEMAGRFSLGTKQAPNDMSMTATQVLAAPHGFVWKMSAGAGLMRLSGSDSAHWTRFWLAGLVPVARFGGTSDRRRSAFGRYVAEAVFWTPAALLPGPGITWEAVSDRTVRVTLRHEGLEQSVELEVDSEGRPIVVRFPRWSDANPEKTYRIQPFGGYLSNHRDFGGFRLPTHVEAGNFFDTDDYFPFFIADVTDIRFP
jgi:hypothetical protein